MRYNTNNTMNWVDTINSGNNGNDEGWGICLPPTSGQPVDPNVWVTGYTMVGTTMDITTAMYKQPIGIKKYSDETPKDFALSQNYPNPFNPTTNIKFAIPKSGFVKLTVTDMTGREVATLINEQLNVGSYEYTFNASNLASGVYFYKLTSGDFVSTKKMTLIK
jgi:hypothetical protein